LLRLAAEANFRSRRPGRVAERGQAIYESFSVCYEARSTSSPTFFNLRLLSHYLHKLDSVYDEFVQAVDQSYRIDRRLSQTPSLPRAKAVALKISSKDIPLGLLCPTFGPLLYVARLGTVAAMLILAFVSLIVSHYDGLPIVAIWPAFRRRAWRTRPARAMIAGAPAAAVSVGVVSFGIWQEWLLSGLFIAAAFVALSARQSAAARGALLPGSE